MESSMRVDSPPPTKEAAAALVDPSLVSHCPSTIAIAECNPVNIPARSFEEIFASDSPPKTYVTEEFSARCVSSAEGLVMACSTSEIPHHMREIESVDVQPLNDFKHEDLHPVDGTSPCTDQSSPMLNSIDPALLTEVMIGEFLDEENLPDGSGIDWSVLEGQAILSEAPTACVSIAVDVGTISDDAEICAYEDMPVADVVLPETSNEGTYSTVRVMSGEVMAEGTIADADMMQSTEVSNVGTISADTGMHTYEDMPVADVVLPKVSNEGTYSTTCVMSSEAMAGGTIADADTMQSTEFSNVATIPGDAEKRVHEDAPVADVALPKTSNEGTYSTAGVMSAEAIAGGTIADADMMQSTEISNMRTISGDAEVCAHEDTPVADVALPETSNEGTYSTSGVMSAEAIAGGTIADADTMQSTEISNVGTISGDAEMCAQEDMSVAAVAWPETSNKGTYSTAGVMSAEAIAGGTIADADTMQSTAISNVGTISGDAEMHAHEDMPGADVALPDSSNEGTYSTAGVMSAEAMAGGTIADADTMQSTEISNVGTISIDAEMCAYEDMPVADVALTKTSNESTYLTAGVMSAEAIAEGTDADTMQFTGISRQVSGSIVSADIVGAVGLSGLEREADPPAATILCASHSTEGHKSANNSNVEAVQESVVESAVDIHIEGFVESSGVAAGHNSHASKNVGVDRDMKQVAHNLQLTDGENTLHSVTGREMDERDVAVHVPPQYTQDAIIKDASQTAEFNAEMKVFEAAETIESVDPASANSIVIGESPKVELERKSAVPTGTGVGESQEAQLKMENEAGITSIICSTVPDAVVDMGALETIKCEEAANGYKAEIHHDLSSNLDAVIGATQSMELIRDLQASEVIDQHGSGLALDNMEVPEKNVCTNLGGDICNPLIKIEPEKKVEDSKVGDTEIIINPSDDAGIEASRPTGLQASQVIDRHDSGVLAPDNMEAPEENLYANLGGDICNPSIKIEPDKKVEPSKVDEAGIIITLNNVAGIDVSQNTGPQASQVIDLHGSGLLAPDNTEVPEENSCANLDDDICKPLIKIEPPKVDGGGLQALDNMEVPEENFCANLDDDICDLLIKVEASKEVEAGIIITPSDVAGIEVSQNMGSQASQVIDSHGSGSRAPDNMEAPEENFCANVDDDICKPSIKIEPDKEVEASKVVEARININTSNVAGIEVSQNMDAGMETAPIKMAESHFQLDSTLSEGAPELEQSEDAQDMQAELEMAPENIVPEHQQKKRGRKPGKKSKQSVKDIPEFELEKQIDDSPSQQAILTEDNDQKRELRKRGRKPSTKIAQKEEEDVCFVCFDGGKLILCDKRSCPKAYHVECTGRASEFFQKKGQWFCGWHVCSQCSRSARMNCYLCPNALCSTCMKGANFLCIRRGRGLCEGCYPLVHMIEHNETINGDQVQVDFNDKETYEGLFKEYWEELKLKINLTLAELEKARKAKEAGGDSIEDGKNINAEEIMGDDDGVSTDSEDRPPTTRYVRLMKRKRLTRSSIAPDNMSASEFEDDESDDDNELESTQKKGRTKTPEFDGWASKELVDLIQSMKEDPKKQLPLFGVKKLLWRYIDDNKLANPRRRGQILCDEKLQKLFGKKHVGRFEMMKLIGLHVASPSKSTVFKGRELQQHGDIDAMELYESDENVLGKRKPRRKVEYNKRSKPDPSEYAAINVKNINLIYLKRSVLDELRNDPELESKAVGAFVRIRVPGNKSDACYRLVQVVGVKQIYDSQDPEKVTDVILDILNLHKREEVTAELVSNQDLVEEECRRLRQSVRCGFIKAMTVGELEEIARALREAKVKDWFEFELLRLSHLRDRASEKGRKKELRECVEKLQLLSSPEEKERQLNAPFEIDADPHMDPDYESDDEELPPEGEIRAPQITHQQGFPTRFSDKSNSIDIPEKQYNHWDSGSFEKKLPESTSVWRPRDPGGKDTVRQTGEVGPNPSSHTLNDKSSLLGPGKSSWEDPARSRDQLAGWNQSSFRGESRRTGNMGGAGQRSGWRKNETLDMGTSTNARFAYNQVEPSTEMVSESPYSPIHAPVANSIPPAGTPGSVPGGAIVAGTLIAPVDFAVGGVPIPLSVEEDSEKEKVWCYQDPTRTIQGPFAMEQLRKWEKTNLFPADLRIWRVTESQDASILLSDALVGRFTNRGFLGPPAQGPSFTNLPLGPKHGTPVNGFPVPPAQVPNANSFFVGPRGSNNSSIPPGSMHGNVVNVMTPAPQRPIVQSFQSGPAQMPPNPHGFPSGPMQGHTFPAGPQGLVHVSGHIPAPNVHGFPSVPTQGSNIHGFTPVPQQGPYYSAPNPQAPNFNTHLPGPLQGANVTGYPPNIVLAPNGMSSQPLTPNFLPGQTHAPNILPGHAQGAHFNNAPLGHAQGPHINSYPMGSTSGPSNNNLSQMGSAITNPGREFRHAPVPNRPANDWQGTGWGPAPDQPFIAPKMEGGSVWQPARDDGDQRIESQNAWRNQGPGPPRRDSRDGSNRGHFNRGPNFRGSDQYRGNDGRFMPKKDLPCKYFSRGLCRKGQACDFRHE